MQKTISFSFFVGLIISELFFLFIPIFLMGMISPMIIFQVTKKAEQSGRSAGNIYAISTCGGILFTLVFGFLIIPHYGISNPVKILGLLVALIGITALIKDKMSAKNKYIALAITFILAALAFKHNKLDEFPPEANMTMVTRSEGLLGELKVIDELSRSPKGEPVVIRKLKTNNIQQNYVFTDMPTQSLLHYVNFTRQLVKVLPKKQTALLVGLGAGSLYKVLRDENISTETVEIDKRIYDIGVNYFGMPEHAENHITDGRYFINVSPKTYDIIILDVIIGESVPGQLITLESFKRCGELLNAGGTLIIEHGGVVGFSNNAFVPSVAETLKAAGFKVSVFNPVLQDNYGDVLFVATKYKLETKTLNIAADVLIKGGPLSDYELPLSRFDNSLPLVFTDDKNNIDLLLKNHYFEVRKSIRKELARYRNFWNS